MKRIVIFIFVVSSMIFMLNIVTASAQSSDIKVCVNGKYLESDVPPVNKEGRILLPVRKIFEYLGVNIVWNGETQVITGIKGGDIIVMQIGSNKAYVNNKIVELDIPAEIIDGRTMVPVRFIVESLNATVEWNQALQTAFVISQKDTPLIMDQSENNYLENSMNETETDFIETEMIDYGDDYYDEAIGSVG